MDVRYLNPAAPIGLSGASMIPAQVSGSSKIDQTKRNADDGGSPGSSSDNLAQTADYTPPVQVVKGRTAHLHGRTVGFVHHAPRARRNE